MQQLSRIWEIIAADLLISYLLVWWRQSRITVDKIIIRPPPLKKNSSDLHDSHKSKKREAPKSALFASLQGGLEEEGQMMPADRDSRMSSWPCFRAETGEETTSRGGAR